MSAETRKQDAAKILDLLAGGPRTASELQVELALTKRRVEDALWYLGSYARVEDVWPTTSPRTYQQTSERSG